MINNTPDSKNVWGVTSKLYKISNIDENYVEEYTGKILSAQNNQLDFLKEDLAQWINKTLGNYFLDFLVGLKVSRSRKIVFLFFCVDNKFFHFYYEFSNCMILNCHKIVMFDKIVYRVLSERIITVINMKMG